jgi:hypothetical protein
MKTASLSVLGACALALSAAAPGFAIQPDDALEGFRQTGEAVNCVNLRQIRSINAVDESHFLVEMRGGQTYLNETRGRCSGADKRFNYLEYRTSGSQLCRGEIVRVRDQQNSFMAGSCSFGSFERLEEIEPAGA